MPATTISSSPISTMCWPSPSTPTPSPGRRPGSTPIRRAPASWPMPRRATTTSGRCATSAGAPTIAGIRSGAARPTRPSKRPSSAKSSRGRSRSRRRCRRSPCARPSAGSPSIACPPRSRPATAASTRKGRETSEHVAFNAAIAAAGGRLHIFPALQVHAPRQHLYQPSEFKWRWRMTMMARRTAEIARPPWRRMLAADMKALIIDPAVHSLGGHHFNAVQRLQDELGKLGVAAPCLGSAYADRRVIERARLHADIHPIGVRPILCNAWRVRRQRRGDRPATGRGDAPVGHGPISSSCRAATRSRRWRWRGS